MGKSGLEALRAPSPWIRHRRSGQLVTETIPRCPSNHPRRRRQRQHDRRKTPIFHAGEPEADPQARPMSRRDRRDRATSHYAQMQNALDAGCWDIEPRMTVSEASSGGQLTR